MEDSIREDAIVKMNLSIRAGDSETAEFILLAKRNVDSNGLIWVQDNNGSVSTDDEVVVYTDETGAVSEIKLGDNILSTVTETKDQFNAYILEANFQQKENEADGFDHESNVISRAERDVDKNPYDPKRIRVDAKTFSIQHVYQMVQKGEIDLSPDFQREFVWRDITRQSRLIESLLLRIPLPVFYLAQEEDGRFKVVDGVQRLTVIRNYMNNKFKLKNLEYLSECEGKWFQNEQRPSELSIDRLYVGRIEQTQLYFNVIDPQTPEQVKYDIFKRINTGGKSLNAQEIRNCLASPTVRTFIKNLSEKEVFLMATRRSISSTRMADKELVLRFAAFFLQDKHLFGQREYKGDMDGYLDNTIDLLKKQPQENLKQIEKAFEISMDNAYSLFGEKSFRKSRLINKALFLSWSRVLCDVSTDMLQTLSSEDAADVLEKEILADPKYTVALSMATNDARNVEYSYHKAKKVLERILGNEEAAD